jgi:ABC-type multidrug transport system, ATPase component
VSGISKSGELCAIMSPSGAGKTTLLAALNKRVKGLVQGEILLNGCPISRTVMSRISGYVAQQDFLIEELTVLEHLQFMAKLTMDRRTTWLELNKTITRVMENLGINHRRQVQISGLSGGQRKRLALAVQVNILCVTLRPATLYQVDLTGTPDQIRLSGLPDTP